MKTPKLLPWHARRAGVPLARAEALWREAVEQATADTGWVGNTAYWNACEAGFLKLLESEARHHRAAQLSPLLRVQHRIGRLPLLAMEDIVTTLHACWRQQRCRWPALRLGA